MTSRQMNRKPRPKPNAFQVEHARLLSRRRFLLASVGGSIALLFPLSSTAITTKAARTDTYSVLDAVLGHLLPSEANSPGAEEINALAYFRFVIGDDSQDAQERDFLRQGTIWLDDLSRERQGASFTALDEVARERMLRQVAESEAGENWLSTVLLYLMEALLTDPVYGGNANQKGWNWLQHTPGFPRPPADKRYTELLKR